jgi:hypothetical protein
VLKKGNVPFPPSPGCSAALQQEIVRERLRDAGANGQGPEVAACFLDNILIATDILHASMYSGNILRPTVEKLSKVHETEQHRFLRPTFKQAQWAWGPSS